MEVSMPPIKLYGVPLSGHTHRVRLFLSILGLPLIDVPVDLAGGEHKRPEFLALNPFGQIPVIDDDGLVLADSTAILVYLAGKYADASWWPEDVVTRAEIQRWLSAAAGPIFNGPNAARLVVVFKRDFDHDRAKAVAHQFLAVLEGHLAGREFLVGEGATIADIAIYSYVAVAPEGGVSLESYPNVRAWLVRVEALSGFVAMPKAA
jgi:glutathione S-transferase